MLATALAQSAAEKAAADQADKEAALAAAADRAKANRESYEIQKGLANVDATHRARRAATAAGSLEPPAATARILADNSQALRDPSTGQEGVATSPTQCRPGPTVLNRFSQAVGCFSLLPSQNQANSRRRRKETAADGTQASA